MPGRADADLAGTAQTLLRLTDEADSRVGKYRVTVSGGQAGDGSTQTNAFG